MAAKQKAMILYKNNKAVNEGDILEIEYWPDQYRKKKFYSVYCIFLRSWTAADGSTGIKSSISTNFDKIQKDEIIKYFQERIKNEYPLRKHLRINNNHCVDCDKILQ